MAEQIDVVGKGPRGPKGWTPVLVAQTNGARRLVGITDWTGGAGERPATGFLGATGLVSEATDATDFAPRGLLSVAQDEDANLVLHYNDGTQEILPAYFADVLAKAADVVERHEDIVERHDDIIAKHQEVGNDTVSVTLSRQDVEDRQTDIIERQADITVQHQEVSNDTISVTLSRQDVEGRQTDIIERQADITAQHQEVSNDTISVTLSRQDVEDRQADIIERQADITAQHEEVSNDTLSVTLSRQDVEDRQADIIERQDNIVIRHDDIVIKHGEVDNDATAVEASRQQVSGWFTTISGWYTLMQGWYNAVSGWYTQIQTWVSQVSTNAAAVEAKRVEVNNVTAQAANIVFAGSTDFPTVPPLFSWQCDSGELDPRIDLSYTGNLSVTDQRGVLRSVPQGARALDYDPVTRACLGLPVWESRTELLQSDTFQTGWSVNGLASLPVQSADTRFGSKFRLIPGNSASLQRALNGNINLIGGQTYTATVIASAGEYQYLSIRIGSGTGLPPDYIVFDLINKTTTTAAGLTATIKDLGGGVVKCMLTGTATSSGGSNLYVGVSNTFTTNYATWSGDGTSGIFVYRANFQAGASDAPLLAGGTTRGAISAQIQGAAFQQMYNKYEGTWVIETGPLSATGVSRVILCQSDGVVGTATEISLVLHAAGELRLDVPINGDYSSGRIGIPVSSTTNNRIVFSYKGSVATMSVNGGAVVAKTYSLGIPTNATKAILGANRLFSTSLNERQREIAYYPVALPDAQLQALSRL